MMRLLQNQATEEAVQEEEAGTRIRGEAEGEGRRPPEVTIGGLLEVVTRDPKAEEKHREVSKMIGTTRTLPIRGIQDPGGEEEHSGVPRTTGRTTNPTFEIQDRVAEVRDSTGATAQASTAPTQPTVVGAMTKATTDKAAPEGAAETIQA